jgi:hypothetical protein
MSTPSRECLAQIEKCDRTLDALHASISDIISERVLAASAEHPSVPVEVLRGLLMTRTGGCLCNALKKIAAGADGI